MADLMRLLPRHYGLLKMVLAGAFTNEQMCQATGYSPQGLRNIINSPLFQDELARRRKEVTRTENEVIRDGLSQATGLLNQTAYAAVEKMEQVMATAADPKVALDAADKILKHAYGREKATGGGTTINIVPLNDKKLEGLRSVLAEIGFYRSEVPAALEPPKDMIDGELVNAN